MTLVHNEYDEICSVCHHPLGEDELELDLDMHDECREIALLEYDEEMKKVNDTE